MTRRGLQRRATCFAWLAALSGCLLLDDRDALKIEPAGVIYNYRNRPEFYIRVDGSLETFTVQVGDTLLDGTFPANRTVLVPLPSEIPSGTYRLVVRAREGSVPRSTERTLVVDRTPVTVSVNPAPGRVTSGEPFTIAITFSRALVSFSTSPAGASLSSDARTVSYALPASLDVLGSISIGLDATPVGSPQPEHYGFGPWYAPEVDVVVTQPPDGQATNGAIAFAASATGDVPSTAELMAGDMVVATLGPPPWSLDWDTSAVPEGTYQLSVRSRGYHVTAFSWPRVTIDRTPPTIVRCGPEYSPADDVALLECVIVEFSERVIGAAPDLLLGGVSRGGTWAYYPPGSYEQRAYRLCPPWATVDPATLPAVQTVSLPPQQDAAGNLAGPNTCPQMTLPPWRRPWGDGPLATAQGMLAAGEVALWMEAGIPYALESGTLMTLPPAGTAGEGVVGLWNGPVESDWSRLQTLNVEPSSTASELGRGVWVERVDGGPGHVYRIDNDPPGPLNRDPLRDARDPSGSRGGSYGPPAVAWSEEVPSGGRAIFAKSQGGVGSLPEWYDIGGPLLSDPAAVADEPSLARYALFGGGSLLAWIETVPGGVPQVHAARGPSMNSLPPSTTWTPLPDVVNVDASQIAADPSAWGFATLGAAVAWLEGGKALARHSEGNWVAEVINVDPAAATRSPRLDGSAFDATVYWVEESSGGDEIWARRWDGSTWVLLPGPLNAGIPGAVRALDVDGGVVAWVDDVGGLRIRVANFF